MLSLQDDEININCTRADTGISTHCSSLIWSLSSYQWKRCVQKFLKYWHPHAVPAWFCARITLMYSRKFKFVSTLNLIRSWRAWKWISLIIIGNLNKVFNLDHFLSHLCLKLELKWYFSGWVLWYVQEQFGEGRLGNWRPWWTQCFFNILI